MSEGELFDRHPANPILTAENWPYPVNAVFNPAAAMHGDETVLLVRVEDRRGISHLTAARSANGVDGWSVDEDPLLAPTRAHPDERWGFEDARVVWIPELERFMITCTVYGPTGPAVFLASTEDFRSIERFGVIRDPEDKNAALLPDRIDGQWILLHRPRTGYAGARAIQISRSRDLVTWSTPEPVFQPRAGAWWDSVRIGIGPPPLRTEHGWLLIYHGVKQTVAGEIYRVGLALLDLNEPTQVLRRLPNWVFAPLALYERTGDVPNVVFPCGLVHDPKSDEVRLYYGAADSTVCLATAKLADLVDALLADPRSA